jgi:hypothetical protein
MLIDVLDGVLQTYIGMVTKVAECGIPYCVEEFEFLKAPSSRSLRALVTCPPNWTGPSLGVSTYGDAFLYPLSMKHFFVHSFILITYDEDGTLLCSLKTYKGLVTPQKEPPKSNLRMKWQPKCLTVSHYFFSLCYFIFDIKYLQPSKELLSSKMNQEAYLHFSAGMMSSLKQSLREVLDISLDESMYCDKSSEEIAKIIEKHPSPHKDCIYIMQLTINEFFEDSNT